MPPKKKNKKGAKKKGKKNIYEGETDSEGKQNENSFDIQDYYDQQFEEEFEVEEIIEKQVSDGQVKFLVKWSNNPEPSWEPIENLEGCMELVSEYLEYEEQTIRKKNFEWENQLLNNNNENNDNDQQIKKDEDYFLNQNGNKVVNIDINVEQEIEKQQLNKILEYKKEVRKKFRKIGGEKDVDDEEIDHMLTDQSEEINYPIDKDEMKQILELDEIKGDQENLDRIKNMQLDREYFQLRQFVKRKISKNRVLKKVRIKNKIQCKEEKLKQIKLELKQSKNKNQEDDDEIQLISENQFQRNTRSKRKLI